MSSAQLWSAVALAMVGYILGFYFQHRDIERLDVSLHRRSIRALLEGHGFDIVSLDQSTYGLRILLKRFESLPFHKKWVKRAGTSFVFLLGKMLHASNHMTVCAIKRSGERLNQVS